MDGWIMPVNQGSEMVFVPDQPALIAVFWSLKEKP
jgi:hypothetical protein